MERKSLKWAEPIGRSGWSAYGHMWRENNTARSPRDSLKRYFYKQNDVCMDWIGVESLQPCTNQTPCTNARIRDTAQLIYASASEADAYMFYICFFGFFFRSPQNTRQPFSGTAERIFMKLLPNDSWEKWSFQRRTQMAARPPNYFVGLKSEIVRTGVAASRTTQN